jgi:hypothetical protein
MLHDTVGAWKEQRRVAAVIPSHDERFAVVGPSGLKYGGLPIGLTGSMAADNQFITWMRLHGVYLLPHFSHVDWRRH